MKYLLIGDDLFVLSFDSSPYLIKTLFFIIFGIVVSFIISDPILYLKPIQKVKDIFSRFFLSIVVFAVIDMFIDFKKSFHYFVAAFMCGIFSYVITRIYKFVSTQDIAELLKQIIRKK